MECQESGFECPRIGGLKQHLIAIANLLHKLQMRMTNPPAAKRRTQQLHNAILQAITVATQETTASQMRHAAERDPGSVTNCFHDFLCIVYLPLVKHVYTVPAADKGNCTCRRRRIRQHRSRCTLPGETLRSALRPLPPRICPPLLPPAFRAAAPMRVLHTCTWRLSSI